MDFNIISPKNKSELLRAMKQEKNFRFGAGYTDLLMELKKENEVNYSIINLAQLNEKSFRVIQNNSGGIKIGALVTAAQIVNEKSVAEEYPVLLQAAHSLASNQIRQVATVGGNLCTASPSGDIACALVALEAICEPVATTGKSREIPITDFFTGVRKTVLRKNEVLQGIIVPANHKNTKHIYSDFIKIGTRRSMECSVVSLAYHIQVDKNGVIIKAGVAIGASAPTIRFAESACDFLIRKKFKDITEEEKELFAKLVLSYASPISDIRATAWYRKEVLFNISKSIFE